MALISLGSVGAAPGVTTLSVVAAGCWPRPVVLVEADPSGGVLAVRYRLGRTPGLSGLAATVRQGAPPEAIWSYAQMLPGDLPVVVSPESGPVATAILEDAAHALADWCASQDQVDVIVDCGRIAVRDVTWPLWAVSDEMLLLARPRADELYPLAHRSRALASHVRSLGTVLVGERPYRPEEVAEQLRLPVRGVIADDPRAARVLATGGSGRTLRRSPLVRSTRSLVDALCLRLGIPVVTADDERLLAGRGAGEAGGRRRQLWKAIGPGRTAAPSTTQPEPAPAAPQEARAQPPQPAEAKPAEAGRRLGGAPGSEQPAPAAATAPSQAPGWATAGNEAVVAREAPGDQAARPAPAAPAPPAPDTDESAPDAADPGTQPRKPQNSGPQAGEEDPPSGGSSGAIPMPAAEPPPAPAERPAQPPAPPSTEDAGESNDTPASPPPPPGSTMRAVVGKLTGGGFPAPPTPPDDEVAPRPPQPPPPPPPPPAGFRQPNQGHESDVSGGEADGQARSDRNGRKGQLAPLPPPPPPPPSPGSAAPNAVLDASPSADGDGLEGFIKAADALENLAASAKMPSDGGDNLAAASGADGEAQDENIDMLERTARVLADGAHPLPETGETPAVGLPPLERRPTGQVPVVTFEKSSGDLTDPEGMSNNGGRGDGDGTQRDDHRQGDDDKITQSANPGPDRDAHLEPTPAVPAAAAGGAVSGRRTARPDPGAACSSDSADPPGPDGSQEDGSAHDSPSEHGDAITTAGRRPS